MKRRLTSAGRSTAGSDQRNPLGSEPNPTDPDVLEDFRLFAVVKSWMDEDIIEATVRHAMAQGVEKVFVVDNDSADATVARAEAAGAMTSDVYHTEKFSPRLAQVLINGVVARESLASAAPHIWWLHLDSDEFPEGPDGSTLRDYLARLDRRFRIVGARVLNHLPDRKPEYVSGFHPLDFQPLHYDYRPDLRPVCGDPTHWKHPLQRFDRDASYIQSEGGAHHALGGTAAEKAEPEGGIVVHHFQYREEQYSRDKLAQALGSDSSRALRGDALQGHRVRLASLDAVYAQRWDEVETTSGTVAAAGVKEWPHLDQVRRWYTPEDLENARRRAERSGR